MKACDWRAVVRWKGVSAVVILDQEAKQLHQLRFAGRALCSLVNQTGEPLADGVVLRLVFDDLREDFGKKPSVGLCWGGVGISVSPGRTLPVSSPCRLRQSRRQNLPWQQFDIGFR